MTLMEMIFFMVIVGVALAGIVSVLGVAMRGSADLVSHKQALAIAEAVIEEVALKPFTYCDLDDPAVFTATSTTSCTAPAQNHEGTTFASRRQFDNVIDYAGFTAFANPGDGEHKITDHSGTHTFPAGYSVTDLTVTAEGLNGIGGNDSLRISVTVAGPGNTLVKLDTYRTRYAPNFNY